MTLTTAIKILEHYQKWRKGEIDDIHYTPKELSEAIDIAINLIKGLK